MSFSLTSQQKQDYLNNGYLVIRDFIATDECQNLIERAHSLIDQFNPDIVKTIFSTKDQRQARHKYFLDSGDKIHFFFEEGAIDESGELKYDKTKCINKFGHGLHDLDPVFHSFSRLNQTEALVKDLGFIDPLILQSMYICKQPYIGGEVTCHQDATYLYVKNQPVVGLWFALEDATIENGCLWAIPGGHNDKLKSRFIRQQDDKMKMEVFDETPWALEKMIPLEVPRGSVIVLNGLAPHMSKENVSARSRHAYTLHFMSHDGDYAEDNWLRRSENNPFTGF
jgi:phytanoyl-CoA hydroxylase